MVVSHMDTRVSLEMLYYELASHTLYPLRISLCAQIYFARNDTLNALGIPLGKQKMEPITYIF